MFRFADENISVNAEIVIPVVASPAMPWIENVGDGTPPPSKLGVGTGDDEERFAPGEGSLWQVPLLTVVLPARWVGQTACRHQV
jgi:hypothetical protein